MRCARPWAVRTRARSRRRAPTSSRARSSPALLARVPQVKPAEVEDLVARLRDARGRARPQRRARGRAPRRPARSSRARRPSTASARAACRPSRSRRAPSRSARYDVVVAGGVESMTMVPMTGNKLSAPRPRRCGACPAVVHADGHHGRERREEVRHLARRSGRVRAAEPAEGGGRAEGGRLRAGDRPRARRSRYDDGKRVDGRVQARRAAARDTTLEGLAALKPAFSQGRQRHRRATARRSPTARPRRS